MESDSIVGNNNHMNFVCGVTNISLEQAVDAHKAVRLRGSHIF
jgi:hypothetical protein